MPQALPTVRHLTHAPARGEIGETVILLMVQKSGVHQVRLVFDPITYDGFYTSQVVQDFFHQQYVLTE